jgi:hypothetical protein
MIPEEKILHFIMHAKYPYERVALVVPNASVFTSVQKEALFKKEHIWITNADRESVYRLAGLDFGDVYFYDISMNSFAVEYMRTRLRYKDERIGGLHFYFSGRRE